MALKGDLASVDLAQVFQMLALNKKVGLLSIHSPVLWKVLYFDHRGVTLYFNEHAVLDRVVVAMIRTARLSEAAAVEARSHSARHGESLQASLLAGGYLGEAELSEQLRWELAEEIYDLFFCKDARFEFFEGVQQLEGRDGVVDDRFFFNTDTVIMEAARRIDEWSYISEKIPSLQEVLQGTGIAVDPASVEPECMAVLDLIDGRRNVARITELSGLASFLVCKHLCSLLDGNFVTQVSTEDLLPGGEECMAEGRLVEAINLFERSLALGAGVPEVHSRVAEAYESSQQFENAAYHLKCDAEYRVAAGDYKGAVSKLRAAVNLVPTDLAARDRLVEVALAGNEAIDGFDPLQEGKDLVDLLMAVGDLARVRSVLERLLRVQPDDVELKKTLINVHTKAGDQKRVIELHEAIADDLLRHGKPLEAIGHLQKILILDRTRTDISERVRQLYELDERTRSRRRSLAMLGAVFCLLVALGGVYFFYDRHAERAFAEIDVSKQVEQKDFARAAAIYQRFIADYPLTLAIDRANEELTRIEAMRTKYEAQVAHEKAAHDREVDKLRADYRSRWAKHRELFLGGNPEASLQELTKVRDLVQRAGDPDDLAWALEQQVEKTWTNLQEFLRRAEELGQRSRKLLDAGDWQQARAAALELLEKYEITQPARQVRIPVMLYTRPAGATVLQGGKPIMHRSGDGDAALVTPCVVLCGSEGTTAFAVNLEGFEPQAVVVAPRQQARVELVLKVVPVRNVRFESPAQTGVGAAAGKGAVGLRGGRIGFFQLQDGKLLGTVDFAGLRAVDSTPAIGGSRAFVLTNEGTVECLLLEQGSGMNGWAVRVEAGSNTELLVRDGRVMLVDKQNRLLCLEQGDGRLLWSVPIDGHLSGPPTFERRAVRVGTLDGTVMVIDAGDGKVVATLHAPAGLTTRVFATETGMLFGCNDGTVRAIAEDDGKVQWTQAMGRTLADGELLLARSGVVAMSADQKLQLLGLNDGLLRATATLKGAPLPGILQVGKRLLVTMRMPRNGKIPAHDVLQALDIDDLGVLWDYVDVGSFTGPVTTDGEHILLPDSNGDVVIFR